MDLTFTTIRPSTLDRIEKVFFAVIFTAFAMRMTSAFHATGSLILLLYLFDQLLVLVFILARRSTDAISIRGSDWVAGFGGTLLPLMLAAPGSNALLPAYALMALMVTGTSIHLIAKLTLRRSFGVVAANRGVKTFGIYKMVRHPMYLGYMITQLGLFLSGPSIYNFVMISLCWGLIIWRINAEEHMLMEDPEYRQTAGYRLVPGLY